jgi:hypothetical protein
MAADCDSLTSLQSVRKTNKIHVDSRHTTNCAFKVIQGDAKKAIITKLKSTRFIDGTLERIKAMTVVQGEQWKRVVVNVR